MTKNIKGGKGAKKRARKYINNKTFTRDMIYKQDNQEYGKLTKALGCRRFTCLCSDGKERTAWIPGSLHFVKFRVDDFVLVSLRIGMDPLKCDICYKYNPTECLQLQEEGLITNIVKDENAINEEILFEEKPVGPEIEINLDDLDDI
jgi:initiation factor 1A